MGVAICQTRPLYPRIGPLGVPPQTQAYVTCLVDQGKRMRIVSCLNLESLTFSPPSFLDPDNFILAQVETLKTADVITKTVANLVGSVTEIQTTA